MNKSDFATLCGITKPMVSKYSADGLLVMSDGKTVDARATLDALHGHLNDDKRHAALEKLDLMEGKAPAPPTSRANAPVKQTSAKARRDHFDALLKEAEYRQKIGQLLDGGMVAQAAEQAVGALREAWTNSRREIAQALCVKFDIAADKETAVMRFLTDQIETVIGRFGEMAAKMAIPPPDTVPEIDLGDFELPAADPPD